MPGSGALGNHAEGVIKSMEDYIQYPWETIPDLYFKKFKNDYEALSAVMPEGMKAIGGVGNGVFECVQDIVGYMPLCYLRVDEPELYEMLFKRVGDMLVEIWSKMLAMYDDTFCVYRFGDDLGFKSTTLLATQDVKELIVPQYKRIIEVIHKTGKPFLLHSCGCIFDVMPEIIAAGIDAKHSNEDAIAPFSEWVQRYGAQIGNFGGIDTDAVCRLQPAEMETYIKQVFMCTQGHGGFAFGTGNSVPEYVPVENYLCMNHIARTLRGETDF
ncbi:MAG: uroporphyrinogen decarboxylase family protein [Ruthenibacterium sp.]